MSYNHSHELSNYNRAFVIGLHIWGMSTSEAALTAHLLMPTGYPGDAF
jgi:cobalt-zinc-cadmium efflux system protein